jgi:hypothetical protein
MSKPLKDRAAILSDHPAPFEARVVLEGDGAFDFSRPMLYSGNMETAERVMTCWNVQLGVEVARIRRYHPIEGISKEHRP